MVLKAVINFGLVLLNLYVCMARWSRVIRTEAFHQAQKEVHTFHDLKIIFVPLNP
jgi:hypothetical protein